MLLTLALVLLVLWTLGVVSAVTLGGLIHVLLVGAVCAAALRAVSRKTAAQVTSERSTVTPRLLRLRI